MVDEGEPVAGALGGDVGAGDGGRDHGADSALPGQDPGEQDLGGVADAFARVGAGRDRGQRLGGVGPDAEVGFQQQRDKVGEVPVGGGLGDQGRPGHRRHGDLRTVAGQVLHGPDDGGAGAGLLVHAARGGRGGRGRGGRGRGGRGRGGREPGGCVWGRGGGGAGGRGGGGAGGRGHGLTVRS